MIIWGWNNSIVIGYQKVINLLDNTLNQPTKFRTKNWIDINDESHGVYNTGSQIKFKTSMLRSVLCDYIPVSIYSNIPVPEQIKKFSF